MRTSDLLNDLADSLESPDNEILVKVENNPHLTDIVANALISAAAIIRNAAEEVNDSGPEISADDLDEMAVIAEEYDNSGDPALKKLAAVIDELLISISSDREEISRFKAAQDSEIDRLREKYRGEQRDAVYSNANEEHHKEYERGSGGNPEEAINKGVKQFRPLAAPLSTRSCPEHPGEQMMRIADSVYQCSLDKQIYNYEAGYTTMAGNQIPGTGVSNQTSHFNDLAPEHTNFSTREQVLNSD
jgi:hypothetical protein